MAPKKGRTMKRIRAVMYEQQVPYLKLTRDEIEKRLQDEANKRKDFEYAVIEHDKDNAADGKPVVPHLHVIARTAKGSGLSLTKWAEIFDDDVNRIEIWQGQWNNAIAYLVHQTDGASDKYQYDISEVTGNIDIEQSLKDGHKAAGQARVGSVRLALEKLDAGVASYTELADSLLGDDKVQFLRKAKDIVLYKAMKPKPWQPIQVVYLYGDSGTGKTRLARYQSGNNVYVTSSARDPFGKYNNEASVIIDDIRGNMMDAGELLRLLDPYNDQRTAPARYSDKDFRDVSKIFITNVDSPFTFWNQNYLGEPYEQFRRRLSNVIHVLDNATFEIEETREIYDLPWKYGGVDDE